MKKSWLKTLLAGSLLMAASSTADNPIVNYHYLADPTAMVIGDRFWIIADLDDENVTGYNIKAYYALSSKDMKNWTDHGEVFRAASDTKWAGAAWAPAAAWRNNQVYIYYPNATSGIGVATASSPVGPYTDPVGHAIVDHSASRGNLCGNIVWCFDPGVFIDTDGQGYLIWGGGGVDSNPNNLPSYGSNFRMMRLKSDMVTLEGSVVDVKGTTNSLEAPYITKRNGVYYLSYNARGQSIDYATSTSPTGLWTYKGTVMKNPSINGQNINAYNNTHHGFAEFKGKWYAAYHDRRTAIANKDSKPDLHRSVSIDVLEYESNGNFKNFVYTNAGPAQIENFYPYDSIPATTSSLQNGIRSKTVRVTAAAPYSMLIPMPSKNSWIRLSNVDFGTGAAKFRVNAASLNANNSVQIMAGSTTGTTVGTCKLTGTGAWGNFATTECAVTGLKGVVANLYLKFTGSDSTAGLKWWRFVPSAASSSSSAQSSSSVKPSSSSVKPSSSSALSSSSVKLSSSSATPVSSSSAQSSSGVGGTKACIAFVNGVGGYEKNCYHSGLSYMAANTCYTMNPDRGVSSPWINNNANDTWWWVKAPCTGILAKPLGMPRYSGIPARYEVYDMQGKLHSVSSQKPAHLPAGSWMLMVRDSEGRLLSSQNWQQR